MKKISSSKLSLRAQTLRLLSDDALGRVAGGNAAAEADFIMRDTIVIPGFIMKDTIIIPTGRR
jgi:hypothetical protein